MFWFVLHAASGDLRWIKESSSRKLNFLHQMRFSSTLASSIHTRFMRDKQKTGKKITKLLLSLFRVSSLMGSPKAYFSTFGEIPTAQKILFVGIFMFTSWADWASSLTSVLYWCCRTTAVVYTKIIGFGLKALMGFCSVDMKVLSFPTNWWILREIWTFFQQPNFYNHTIALERNSQFSSFKRKEGSPFI